MQGRDLQTLLIIMFVSTCGLSIARAQDDIGLAPADAPSVEASPTAPASGGDEFSEFDEAPAATATGNPSTTPTPAIEIAPLPSTSELEPSQALTPQTPEPAPPKAEMTPVPPAEKPTVFHASPTVPVQNLGGDEPDFAKEERLHRIYQKYNVQPTPEASWEKAMNAGKGNVYDVQSGDTLWSISQTLFGDAQYWPKVWSINNETFPNPHEITPSTKIRFFAGGLTEAPSLAVTPEEKPVIVAPPLAKNEINPSATPVEAATDLPAAVFPKQIRKSHRLQIIPQSLPLYRLGGVNKPNAKVEIISGYKAMASPLVPISHYVIEGDLTSVGHVIEVENGADSASLFQYIVIQVNVASEKIFHVLREDDAVRSPFIKGGPVGKMIELEGEVEVLEKVSEDKNYYRAIVRKAISPVKVGSFIRSGGLPMADVIPGTPEAAITATLIGGQYSAERKLYPQFSIVFIDAGTAGGLRDGQTLNVFANLKSRNEKTVVEYRNRLVGHVKIIHISDNFATAYVTEAFEELQMGDHVGGGATQSITEKTNPIEDADMSLEDTPENAPEKPAEASPNDAGEDSLDL